MRDGMLALPLHLVWSILLSVDLDFLGSLLMAIGGIIAPVERRTAARAYVHEREMQNNGRMGNNGQGNFGSNGRHDWTAPPAELPKDNVGQDYS
jgi:hypothetical protein